LDPEALCKHVLLNKWAINIRIMNAFGYDYPRRTAAIQATIHEAICEQLAGDGAAGPAAGGGGSFGSSQN
jgi:hypothetical protein